MKLNKKDLDFALSLIYDEMTVKEFVEVLEEIARLREKIAMNLLIRAIWGERK